MQDVAVREVAGLLAAGAPLPVCQGVEYPHVDGGALHLTTVFCYFL